MPAAKALGAGPAGGERAEEAARGSQRSCGSAVRVSIVMAARNMAQYVEQAARSALCQTFTSVELIAIDDASTDATFSILSRLAAEAPARMRVLRMAECVGLSQARNAGIDAARGQWIAFLDADDILAPDALQRMIECADRAPEADVVATPMLRFRGPTPPAAKSGGSMRSMRAAEALALMLYQRRGMDCSACGKLFRAELVGGSKALRFRRGIAFEDLHLVPRLMLRARAVVALDAPLYFYRMHAASFMHSAAPARADVLWVALGVRRMLRDADPALARAAADRAYSAACGLWLLLRGWPETADFSPARVRRRCRMVIAREWRRTLCNSRARAKNRLAAPLLGALAALLGRAGGRACGRGN